MRRVAVGAMLAGGVLLVAGCGGEPFPMVKASGKLVYEDGSPLPPLSAKKGDTLGLIFTPLMAPRDAKTHPRMGTALLDAETASFSSATTHKYGDGLIRGTYKVSIYPGPQPLAAVPTEYYTPETTPLEVDASKQPMVLKIRKP